MVKYLVEQGADMETKSEYDNIKDYLKSVM
jgi:hypothetical protein